MFGYIVADHKTLEAEGKQRYRQYYCGLCRQLESQYGRLGRATLTYDMTFLAILLSSLYEPEETQGSLRCLHHPLKRRPYVETAATAYAADMNIILSYYQYLDDAGDENSLLAKQKSKLLEKFQPRIKEKNPQQYMAIADSLQRLGKMERANELNPDLPANCFGELMGSVFVWREDEYADALWRMGASLGRFIYLLDAVNDLKTDIKKQRYNPLIAQTDTDFTPMLTIMMSECAAEFEKLPIRRDHQILQNILYSGVWQKYRLQKKKGANALHD
jgi:hypothetical protein